MIQSSIVNHDIQWLCRKFNEGQLNTNISIQRREVWNIDVKSNLIVSYLCGVPVEDLFFEEDESTGNSEATYKIIDGKNRTITTAQYLNDEFALSKNILKTKLVDEVFGISVNGIVGKKFSELPKTMQNTIKERQIPFTIARPMTENERAAVYFMRNQSVPLSDMELMIPIVGEDTMNSLVELSSHNFIETKSKITVPARKKKGDIRIILEYFMLANKKDIGLTKLEFKTFCDEINESSDIINFTEIKSILDYLDKAFDKKLPYLNRANLPLIFIVANKSIEKNVPQEKFASWIIEYFDNIKDDEEYKKKTKSYKARDVQFRLKAILDSTKKKMLSTK